MASDGTRTELESELGQAVENLQAALRQAAEATAAIQVLLPKVGAIGSLFDELDAVIRSGRQQISSGPSGAAAPYARPTLVVPEGPPTPAPAGQWTADAPPITMPSATTSEAAAETPERPRNDAAGLTCFRLEFESRPGPLDLRTVDDAVSEHPAVRDVALLDYDGRKATLKVWIDGSASPSDVQKSLVDRSSQLFTPDNDITIVALEDVA